MLKQNFHVFSIVLLLVFSPHNLAQRWRFILLPHGEGNFHALDPKQAPKWCAVTTNNHQYQQLHR